MGTELGLLINFVLHCLAYTAARFASLTVCIINFHCIYMYVTAVALLDL